MIEKAVNKDNIENEIQDMNDYEEAVNINRTADFERQRHSRQKRLNSAHWRRQEFLKGAT